MPNRKSRRTAAVWATAGLVASGLAATVFATPAFGVTPSVGDVVVADTGNNRLVIVPASGAPQYNLGSGLNAPSGVTFDGLGDVLVADTGNSRVLEVATSGAQSTIGTGLSAPHDVALDTAGNVFIADTGNNRVVKVPAGGGIQTSIGTGLSGPRGVAVDSAGDVFIADTGNARVLEISASDGSQKLAVGSGLTSPAGIDVGNDGTLYIADSAAHSVFVVRPDGTRFADGSVDVLGPTASAITAQGDVLIADPPSNRVYLESRGGGTPLETVFGTGWSNPSGVAVHAPLIADSPGRIAAVGTPYSYAFKATGVPGSALTFGLASGTLPPGLVLASTGVLAGTPTAAGSYTFTVKPGAGAVSTPPITITVAAPGTVFISDLSHRRVVELPSDGSPQITIGYGSAFQIAVDARGDVLFADDDLGVVEIPADGRPQFVLGAVGSGVHGMAVDSAGNVYFANYLQGGPVYKLSVNGALTAISSDSVSNVQSLAVDTAGNVYVTQCWGGVLELPADGSHYRTIDTGNCANGVAIDSNGTLYVSDPARTDIVRTPVSGGPLSTAGNGLNQPWGLALDAAGNLYVAEGANNDIVEIPANGGPLDHRGSGLSDPLGVAVFAPPPAFTASTPNALAQTGRPYAYNFAAVAPAGEPASVSFAVVAGSLPPGMTLDHATGSLSGTPTAPGTFTFGVTAQNAATGSAVASAAIMVDSPGGVFIADGAANRVVAVPAGGGVATVVGNGLYGPGDVALDGAGNLYVADSAHHRVVEVKPNGSPQTTLNIFGLYYPGGLDADQAGNVFIADTGNNRVVEWHADGSVPTTLGASGLNSPTDVAVDGHGNVFIADYGNNRVVKLSSGGAAQTTVGSGLSKPLGVTVDSDGDVFIADSGNNRVVKVPTDGSGQSAVGSGLVNPSGVAIDAAGTVYIADTGNLRVVKIPVAQPQATFLAGLSEPDGVAASAPPPMFTAATPPTSTVIAKPYSYTYKAVAPVGEPAPHFSVHDGELPPGLQLDRTTGVLSGTPTATGTFSFTVEAANAARGTVAQRTSMTVAPDASAPSAALATVPAATLSPSVRVSWSGADSGSGIGYFQLRYRVATGTAGFGSWVYPSTWQHLTGTAVNANSLKQGNEYCWSVRAFDRAGNASAWTSPKCSAVALDDRALTSSAHWTRARGGGWWNGTATVSSTTGATLTKAGLRLARVGIVATLCPRCGSVAVKVGNTSIGTVNLRAGSTKYRQLILLPPFSLRSGTVTIRIISSGRGVQIDGLVTSRTGNTAAAVGSTVPTSQGVEGLGPLLTLNSAIVRRGGTDTVRGVGFAPGETVTATLHSASLVLGTFTADGTGAVTATFTIPDDFAAGPHTLELTSASGETASVVLTVTAGSNGQLSSTGAAPARPTSVGLLMLLAGLLLVSVAHLRTAGRPFAR